MRSNAAPTPVPTLGGLVARLEREVAEYEKARDEQLATLVQTIAEIGQDCVRAVEAVTAGRSAQVAATSDPDNWFAGAA